MLTPADLLALYFLSGLGVGVVLGFIVGIAMVPVLKWLRDFIEN